MISHRRRNVVDLTAIALGLAIGAILAALLLPLARAQADLPDAGTLDRAALIAPVDAGPAAVAPPPNVEPATVDAGLDLASWIWARFRTGQAGLALIVGLQALGLFAIKRWEWVGRIFPRLTRPRALAAVSSLTGSLATVVPIALAGASFVVPLLVAAGTAVGVFLMPTPTQVAGQTVSSGEAVPT